MSQIFSDNLQINSPKQLDNRTGVFDGTPLKWRPFNDIAEFNASWPLIVRFATQTFWVKNTVDSNKADLYALRGDKTPYKVLGDVDLSNYYNKDETDGKILTETNNRITADNLKANKTYVDIQDGLLEDQIELKADSADISSPVIVNYADLVANTYNNITFANQTGLLTYYDSNGFQGAPLTFNSSGVTTLPFIADSDFTGTLIGTSGMVGNFPSNTTFDAFKNQVIIRTGTDGATDNLDTYTTEPSTTNNTKVTLNPLPYAATIKNISLWATRVGPISFRVFEDDGGTSVKQEYTIPLILGLGLNIFTRQNFGVRKIKAGGRWGIYHNSTTNGGVGRKVKDDASYSISTATVDGVSYSLGALIDFEYGVVVDYESESQGLDIEILNETVFSEADPLVKEAAFVVTGDNKFSEATIHNNQAVKNDGSVGSLSGWKYASFELDLSKAKIYASGMFVRPLVPNGCYYRFRDISAATISFGAFTGGDSVALTIPTGAVGFDVDVKSSVETNDEGFANAYIGYVKYEVVSYKGAPFPSGGSPDPVDVVIPDVERINYDSKRRPTFSFIFDDINPTDALVYSIFQEYGLSVNYALRGDNLNSGNKARYLSYQTGTPGGSLPNHSQNHIDMRNSGIPLSTIKDEMLPPKQEMKAAGMKTIGWVSPYSVLNPSYYSVLDKYFGYAFVIAPPVDIFNPADTTYTVLTNPLRMARYSIEGTDIEGNSLQNIKDVIDHAIENTLLINFYAHRLPSTTLDTNGDSFLTEAKLRAILTYIKDKADNFECLILNTDDAVHTYYTPTYNEITYLI